VGTIQVQEGEMTIDGGRGDCDVKTDRVFGGCGRVELKGGL